MQLYQLNVVREDGATLIESVIVLPLFLLMVVVSFDLIRLVYDSLTVRYVTASVMRQASIGEMDQAEIRQAVIGLAANLATRVEPNDVLMCALEAYPCSATMSPVSRSTLMVLEVRVAPTGLVLSAAQKFGLQRRTYAMGFKVMGRIEPTESP